MPATQGLEGSRAEVHVIHSSLVRPMLFAGVEPAVAVLEVTAVFGLLFVVGVHAVTVLLALLYVTVVHSVMAWIARQEPQATILYVRSLGTRDFYAALAGIRARPTRTPPAISTGA